MVLETRRGWRWTPKQREGGGEEDEKEHLQPITNIRKTLANFDSQIFVMFYDLHHTLNNEKY
jgi:hypothetical protein